MKATSTYPITVQSLGNQAYWPLPSGGSKADSFKETVQIKLNSFLRSLVAQLSASNDPHVWETQDADGQMVWNAHDRASGRTIRHASETELRIWLESRYAFKDV